MSDRISPVVQPRYEAEIKSSAKSGNMETAFTVRGQTAAELIEQFRSIELAEQERGYDAYLPSEVYQLAEHEAAS